MVIRRFAASLSAALALLLSGCGGSGTTPTAPPTLVSISLSPQSPIISVGKDQQFTATEVYSDGSTQDITASADWTSATQTVATISNSPGSKGLATSVGMGTSAITATVGSKSSSTTLTVNAVVNQPTWSQAGPVARFSHSAVYDPASKRMVIFGGQETEDRRRDSGTSPLTTKTVTA